MSNKQEYLVDFDQYQRYKKVSQVIEFYRTESDSKVFSVLEIGSNEPKHLRLFLPEDNILFTDIELTEKMQNDSDFQVADGTDLQFEDDSFDFVVATDVLEHVPQERRALLISEALRVSRICSIISFPYASHEISSAENRVATYYEAINHEPFLWLKQHAEMGLPNIDVVKRILSDLGCKYISFTHGNLELWEKMYYSIFDALATPESWNFRRQIDYYYIDSIYEGDFEQPCYRSYFVFSDNDLTSLELHLRSLCKNLNQKQLSVLDDLLRTQRQIHFIAENKSLQNDLVSKDAKILFLEGENKDLHEKWELDVSRWESDVSAWKRDVAQWEKDSNSWTSERNQWQLEKEHLLQECKELEQKLQDTKAINDSLNCEKHNLHNQISILEDNASIQRKKNEEADALIERLKQDNHHMDAIIHEKDDEIEQLAVYREEYHAILQSRFWKYTEPLRRFLATIKHLLHI